MARAIDGVVETDRSERDQRDVAISRRHRRTDHGAEPALRNRLLAADDPRHVAVVLCGGGQQIRCSSGLRMQPPEPTLPRCGPSEPLHVSVRDASVAADVHLSMIGGDQQRCARWQLGDDLGHQRVDICELGVVKRPEATLMRDLVDPVVEIGRASCRERVLMPV